LGIVNNNTTKCSFCDKQSRLLADLGSPRSAQEQNQNYNTIRESSYCWRERSSYYNFN